MYLLKYRPLMVTSVTKDIPITPEDLDIIWQANSYVPPFYEGKALFPPVGTVSFVAMPGFIDSNGNPVNPKKLIYTWSQDTTVLGDKSGYGKNVLTVQGTHYN